MLAIDRNGYDPASLTTALVTYATGARPSQAFGFPHRRHRIVGKKAEILTIVHARRYRTSFVVDNGSDTLGWQDPLGRLEGEGAVWLIAVSEDYVRISVEHLWNDSTQGEL